MNSERGREELGDLAFIQARDSGSWVGIVTVKIIQKWSDPGCICGRKAADSFHERGTQH